MAKDVLITPADGKIEFKDTTVVKGTIYESSGDIYIDATNVVFGDGTPANLELGAAGTAVSMDFLGGGTITSSGNALNLGISGDTINLNVTGVTYNFPSSLVTTSTYTASDVLTKLLTVDGTSSGLDADLLDGNHASAFALSSHTHTISNVTNLQTTLDGKANLSGATFTGTVNINTSTNTIPLIVSRLGNAAEALKVGITDVVNLFSYTNDEAEATMKFEIINTDTESGGGANANSGYFQFLQNQSTSELQVNGNKVFHSGNDGASSGLDADLLDGQHGSYYAPLASPTFTGTPAAPTAAAGTNTTQIATTAFVSTAVANLINSAPGALDTLDELAAALGDDANFATTVTNSLAGKLNLTGGTLTGTLNYRMLSNQTTSNLDTAGDNSGFSVFYSTTSATNKPSGSDHAVLTQSYSDAWQTQIATDWRTKQMYFRTQENGTWKTWATMWHSDNDGDGSGLDADLLDGNHASAFALSSHAHGDITSAGAITSTAITPGDGDYIILSDTSASDVLKRGIAIGTGTTTYLRNDGTWATPPDTNTTYSQATTTTLGLVKLGVAAADQTVNSASTTGGRFYPVGATSGGQMYVNVPWTDTDTNTTYTAGVGLVLTGTTFKANFIDETLQNVTANSITTTANRTYAVMPDADGDLVVNVPWTDTDTNTTYTAGVGLVLSGTTFKANLIDETLQSVTAETISTTANRTYAVMPDADGDLVVNVPWTDTDTNTIYTAGTGLTLNGTTFDANVNATVQTVAANAVTATASRTYAVQVDASDNLVVNVPWTDVDTNTNTTYDLTVPESTTAIRLAGSDATNDDVTIAAGSNITVTRDSATQLTIASSHPTITTTSDTTSTASPAFGGTFTAVDSVTRDANGHVTTLNTKTVTIPTPSYPTVNDATLTLATSGTGLSGSATFTANDADNVTFTVTSNATSANTGSAIVARDSSGNFSAGTITASLSGNATTATQVNITNVTTNADYPVLFTSSHTTGNKVISTDSAAGLTYNPSLNGLKITGSYSTTDALLISATPPGGSNYSTGRALDVVLSGSNVSAVLNTNISAVEVVNSIATVAGAGDTIISGVTSTVSASSGSSLRKQALYAITSGTGTTNTGLRISSSGGTENRAVWIESGNFYVNGSAGEQDQVLISNTSSSSPSWGYLGSGTNSDINVSTTANSYTTAFSTSTLQPGTYIMQFNGAFFKTNSTSSTFTLSARLFNSGFARMTGFGSYSITENSTTLVNFYLNHNSNSDGAAGTGFTTVALGATRANAMIQFNAMIYVSSATSVLIRIAGSANSSGLGLEQGSGFTIIRVA